MKLHRFVVVCSGCAEAWFDDVRSAFERLPAGAVVFVTYEPTGFRVRVRRP